MKKFFEFKADQDFLNQEMKENHLIWKSFSSINDEFGEEKEQTLFFYAYLKLNPVSADLSHLKAQVVYEGEMYAPASMHRSFLYEKIEFTCEQIECFKKGRQRLDEPIHISPLEFNVQCEDVVRIIACDTQEKEWVPIWPLGGFYEREAKIDEIKQLYMYVRPLDRGKTEIKLLDRKPQDMELQSLKDDEEVSLLKHIRMGKMAMISPHEDEEDATYYSSEMIEYDAFNQIIKVLFLKGDENDTYLTPTKR